MSGSPQIKTPCSGHHVHSALQELCEQLKALPEINAKSAIRIAAQYKNTDAAAGEQELEPLYGQPGDDCAAFKVPGGYQLFAMEGMLPEFVKHDPKAAGWSSVMVNVSDIAAMGGRATAITNAFWDNDAEHAAELVHHIQRACKVFDVRFAGGHSSIQPHFTPGLAVSIIGFASSHLLSCYHVKPGQQLFLLTDLEGSWHGNHAYWGCVQGKSNEQIKTQWQIPAELADKGLVAAAKDISNGGIIGTLIMLLELTACGCTLDLTAIPRPDGDLLRWLKAFQSFGFLLCVDTKQAAAVSNYFKHSHLQCAPIGAITDTGTIDLNYSGEQTEFWNIRTVPLTNLGKQHIYPNN